MTLQTFTPSIAPSPRGTSTPVINLHEAEFGDGYTQSSPNGLNHIRHTVGLVWDGITPTQKHELDAFFEQHGGWQPFWYQPYGFQTLIKWKCKEWSSTTKSPLTYAATFVQDFSLTV